MLLPWTEEEFVFMSQPALGAREPSGSVELSQQPGLEPADTIFHDANWGGREAKAGHGEVRGLVPLMSPALQESWRHLPLPRLVLGRAVRRAGC